MSSTRRLLARLAALIADENTLGQHMPTIPTFMYHARDDKLVGFTGASKLAQQYCDAGVPLYWRTGTGDHTGPAVAMAGRALDFLQRRFKGVQFTPDCQT